MGKKMNNAPVYFMVAQVRFNPVLNLEAYLAAIQDKMRAAGFPDFKRENAQLLLPLGKIESGQPLLPSLVPQSRYIFGNIDGTAGFVFDNNALAFQTTSYHTFESFSRTFLAGIGFVHEALRLDFTERIGLRYLDAVLPRAGESLSNYLITEVLGLSQAFLERPFQHSFSETVVPVAVGQLVSRVVIQDGKVGVPLGIAALAPKIEDRFTAPTGRHAVLDTDAFCEQREKFDLELIHHKLDALHGEIDQAFKSIVTPHALSVWA